jgi:hypothetical protein
MRDDRWGEPAAEWLGDALTDLHAGWGTEWRRTEAGSYYPTCPCHCPDALKPAELAATGPTLTIRTSEHPAWVEPPEPPRVSDGLPPGKDPSEGFWRGTTWEERPPKPKVDPVRGFRLYIAALREMLDKGDR